MRVVLVHPAGSNWMPGKKDVAAVANRMAPLGLLSIASFLQKEGHDVFVHDCLGPGATPDPAENARAVLSLRPDLVGFSTTTSGFYDACDICALIKQGDPGILTCFGAVHVSAVGPPLLESFPQIDYLCMGEGELTMAELASGNEPGTINGLVWRRGDDVVANPSRENIPDLDSLPFPAYEKLAGFPRGYNLPLFSYVNQPGATMITSRGCPYQCSYCDRSVFRRGYRFNSADYVYEHMKYLHDRFGVRHINVYDDLFTLNRKRITGICRSLIERPLNLNINCAVRVGYADDDLLAMLKQAGFLQLSLGIESADPDMLARHKAGVTLEEVADTVRRIKAHGLRAKGLFMMGLPGETEESIQKTGDFVISLGLDDMNMTKFTPFPGAPLWNSIRDEGEFNEDWRLMNCLNFVFLPKGISSRERLDELYNRHVKRFYSDKKWRRTFGRRLWQHRRSLWYLVKHLPAFLSAKKSFEQ
ncbi:MAG TPA: radical SAM protein [Spirochaetota bacterium]|nr:radical SAM protein [Spirochaetota bacterium]HPI88875.1 radical SAM protein [Spirochaetota bacterium]HPR46995.1 radical SAM protein [Spirochaetota bacterium]